MTTSQMVIMWPNKDGSVTLSQRKASSHTQPQLDRSPQRTAQTHLAISAVSSNCASYMMSHCEFFICPLISALLISALNFCSFFLSFFIPPSLFQFQTQENSWRSSARQRSLIG